MTIVPPIQRAKGLLKPRSIKAFASIRLFRVAKPSDERLRAGFLCAPIYHLITQEEVICCTFCAEKLPPGSCRGRKLNVGNQAWSGVRFIPPRNLRRHCQEKFIHEPTCEKFAKERRAGFV